MPDQQKILIYVLSTYERHGWHCKEITDFVYSLRFNNDYATAYGAAHDFHPAAAARNHIAASCVDGDFDGDWVCMIDNDMAVPLNVLDTVKDAPEDADVVVPVFHLWNDGKKEVKVCWGLGDGIEEKALAPGFHEIVKAGTGVIFIRPRAFKKIPAPWFEYKYSDKGQLVTTEDIDFCAKAKAHGCKIYGNGSILSGHYHTANIARFDEMLSALRGKVKKLESDLDKEKAKSLDSDQQKAECPSDTAEAMASPAGIA